MKNPPKISLRKASFSDVEFLWYLRNQPDVYKYFRNGRSVSWQEHINWIAPVILGISAKDIFIIQKIGMPIGQIKLDRRTLDIGISVLKEFRGKGIATEALTLAIKEIKKQKKVKKVIAEVHKKNLSSIKLFADLGFEPKTSKGDWLKCIFKL